jgi:hypothetical protein
MPDSIPREALAFTAAEDDDRGHDLPVSPNVPSRRQTAGHYR